MGRIVVVSGPPGSGKSTVARLLVSRFDTSALVSGDEFFRFIVSGYVEPWRASAHTQNEVVIAAAAAAAGRLAAGGYTVVYEGVLGPWFLPKFASQAGVPELHYVVLMPSEETCVHRVAMRSEHGFSDVIVTRELHRQFRESLSRHRVVSNEGPVGDTADEVYSLLSAGALEWGGVAE